METFFDRANGEVVISMVETTRKRRYMYNILLARPLETIRKRVQARKFLFLRLEVGNRNFSGHGAHLEKGRFCL